LIVALAQLVFEFDDLRSRAAQEFLVGNPLHQQPVLHDFHFEPDGFVPRHLLMTIIRRKKFPKKSSGLSRGEKLRPSWGPDSERSAITRKHSEQGLPVPWEDQPDQLIAAKSAHERARQDRLMLYDHDRLIALNVWS